MILSLALPLVMAAPALADEVAAQVGSVRGANLPIVAGADQVAGASAVAQSAAGKLFHADLSGLFGACESVGEVVGAAPDVPAVFRAFLQSSSHRSIITNPAWTAMGTGVAAAADGTVYVSVVFCRQTGEVTPEVVSQPAPAESNEASPETPQPAAAENTVDPALAGHAPVLDENLRRAEIIARLDGQARSMLPDWYVHTELASKTDPHRQ